MIHNKIYFLLKKKNILSQVVYYYHRLILVIAFRYVIILASYALCLRIIKISENILTGKVNELCALHMHFEYGQLISKV